MQVPNSLLYLFDPKVTFFFFFFEVAILEWNQNRTHQKCLGKKNPLLPFTRWLSLLWALPSTFPAWSRTLRYLKLNQNLEPGTDQWSDHHINRLEAEIKVTLINSKAPCWMVTVKVWVSAMPFDLQYTKGQRQKARKSRALGSACRVSELKETSKHRGENAIGWALCFVLFCSWDTPNYDQGSLTPSRLRRSYEL